MSDRRRDPWSNLSGPRLPVGPGRLVAECWRCSEERRVLRLVEVHIGDKLIGGALVCDLCLTALLPLNPDPLDVSTAA